MTPTNEICNSIENFIAALLSEKGLSSSTASSYASDLKLFFKSINKPPSEITAKDITNYLNICAQQSATTNNRRISTLKSFFKFLVSENLIKTSPLENIESAKTSRKIPRYLSEKQMMDLINICDTYPDSKKLKLLVLLLYSSGARVSELLSIKTNMINQNNNTMRITGKGNKERIIPISPSVIELINNMNISGPLFVSKKTNKVISRQRAFQIIKKLGEGIGFANLSPHKIRHSFATHLLNNGANILTVQNLLGHSDISTTEIYTHIADQKVIKTLKNCHPMGKATNSA